MRLVLLGFLWLFSSNCGKMTPKMDITVKTEGETTIRHVLDVQFSVCDTIEDVEARIECVEVLLEQLTKYKEDSDKADDN